MNHEEEEESFKRLQKLKKFLYYITMEHTYYDIMRFGNFHIITKLSYPTPLRFLFI